MILGYIDPGSGFNIFCTGAWFIAFCLGFFGIFLWLFRRILIFLKKHRKKIPSVIIAHPVNFPPDKIYGRMLSGMGVPDILGTEGTFTFYTTETLEENIGGKVFRVEEGALSRIGTALAL